MQLRGIIALYILALAGVGVMGLDQGPLGGLGIAQGSTEQCARSRNE